LCPSPDTVGVTKLRTMGLAEHVARVGEMRNSYRILIEKPEGKRLVLKCRRFLE